MALRTRPTALQDAMVGWWPSRYGADDQAGALNEITPGKVLDAIGLVTRGLLLDVAVARGGERLPAGEVITVSDAEAALATIGRDVRPGDAVFFHTGWGGLWARHGVVVVENLRLADAARDRLGEFLLVISHAKLRGATGAWVAPLAIV